MWIRESGMIWIIWDIIILRLLFRIFWLRQLFENFYEEKKYQITIMAVEGSLPSEVASFKPIIQEFHVMIMKNPLHRFIFDRIWYSPSSAPFSSLIIFDLLIKSLSFSLLILCILSRCSIWMVSSSSDINGLNECGNLKIRKKIQTCDAVIEQIWCRKFLHPIFGSLIKLNSIFNG